MIHIKAGRYVRLAGILALLIACLGGNVCAQVVFTPPVTIANSPGAEYQQVALGTNGSIYVVWLDDASGSYQVMFSRSRDGGTTFSAPETISSASQNSLPQIALDLSGNIVLAWTNLATNVPIYFSRSTDGGVSFSAPEPDTVAFSSTVPPPANSSSGLPEFALDPAGNIDVVWSNNNGSGGLQIYFNQSRDGGATFSTPVNVSNDANTATQPQIAVDSSGAIDVAWDDAPAAPAGIPGSNLLFSHSSDGGASFSAAVVVDTGYGSHTEGTVQLVIGVNHNIYLSWMAGVPNGGALSYFSRSTDSGASFSGRLQIAGQSDSSPVPEMAVDATGNIIAITWDTGEQEPTAQLSWSGNGGATFYLLQIAPPLSHPNGIAIDSAGTFDIVYGAASFGESANSGLMFTQSVDHATFSPAQNLTPSGDAGTISVDSANNIYISYLGAGLLFVRSTTTVLSSVTLSPTTVTAGNGATGTVALSAAAPAGGEVVSLSSSNSGVASVPGSVTVPAGSTSATFNVTTMAVSASTPVTISASLNGVTQSTTLTVAPASSTGTGSIVLQSVAVSPTTVIGGSSSIGTVMLSTAAPVGGTVVSLSSSNTGVATVPGTVTVASGSTSQTFTIATTTVSTSTQMLITASSNGVTESATLTVSPATSPSPTGSVTLSSLTLSPLTVIGGTPSTATLTLSGAAPAGGISVCVNSNNTAVATVTSPLTIAQGATSTTFAVATSIVSSSTTVEISACYQASNASANLTVLPLLSPTFSVTASPTALTIMSPGQSTSTTLTLTSENGLTGAGSLASTTCGLASSEKITCALSAFTLPANGTATATLTFASTASSSTSARVREFLLVLLLPMALASFAIRRWKRTASDGFQMTNRKLRFAKMALTAALVLVSGAVIGCGRAGTSASNNSTSTTSSTSGTPTGVVQGVNATVTIGGVVQTVPNLSLSVQ